MAEPFVRSVVLKREEIDTPDDYPFSIPAIRDLEELQLGRDVTLLAGENGSGKSTLVEAIAVALGFNAEGGSRNMTVATRTSHSQLHEHLRLIRGARTPRNGFFLRAESFFNVATHIEQLDAEPLGGSPIIDAYGGRSLHEQSHGESFLSLILNRFGPNGLTSSTNTASHRRATRTPSNTNSHAHSSTTEAASCTTSSQRTERSPLVCEP